MSTTEAQTQAHQRRAAPPAQRQTEQQAPGEKDREIPGHPHACLGSGFPALCSASLSCWSRSPCSALKLALHPRPELVSLDFHFVSLCSVWRAAHQQSVQQLAGSQLTVLARIDDEPRLRPQLGPRSSPPVARAPSSPLPALTSDSHRTARLLLGTRHARSVGSQLWSVGVGMAAVQL